MNKKIPTDGFFSSITQWPLRKFHIRNYFFSFSVFLNVWLLYISYGNFSKRSRILKLIRTNCIFHLSERCRKNRDKSLVFSYTHVKKLHSVHWKVDLHFFHSFHSWKTVNPQHQIDFSHQSFSVENSWNIELQWR